MRYWFVIKRGTDGSCYYGTPLEGNEKDEEEMLKIVMAGTEEIGDKLCLLIQIAECLPIINQVYPYQLTEETAVYMERLLSAIYG